MVLQYSRLGALRRDDPAEAPLLPLRRLAFFIFLVLFNDYLVELAVEILLRRSPVWVQFFAASEFVLCLKLGWLVVGERRRLL